MDFDCLGTTVKLDWWYFVGIIQSQPRLNVSCRKLLEVSSGLAIEVFSPLNFSHGTYKLPSCPQTGPDKFTSIRRRWPLFSCRNRNHQRDFLTSSPVPKYKSTPAWDWQLVLGVAPRQPLVLHPCQCPHSNRRQRTRHWRGWLSLREDIYTSWRHSDYGRFKCWCRCWHWLASEGSWERKSLDAVSIRLKSFSTIFFSLLLTMLSTDHQANIKLYSIPCVNPWWTGLFFKVWHLSMFIFHHFAKHGYSKFWLTKIKIGKKEKKEKGWWMFQSCVI